MGVQAGGAGAQHRRVGVAAADLVGQEEFEERAVAHCAGSGQGPGFGQGVFEPGADGIDDMAPSRHGAMGKVFDGAYARPDAG
jgi:hypothetical protein